MVRLIWTYATHYCDLHMRLTPMIGDACLMHAANIWKT